MSFAKLTSTLRFGTAKEDPHRDTALLQPHSQPQQAPHSSPQRTSRTSGGSRMGTIKVRHWSASGSARYSSRSTSDVEDVLGADMTSDDGDASDSDSDFGDWGFAPWDRPPAPKDKARLGSPASAASTRIGTPENEEDINIIFAPLPPSSLPPAPKTKPKQVHKRQQSAKSGKSTGAADSSTLPAAVSGTATGPKRGRTLRIQHVDHIKAKRAAARHSASPVSPTAALSAVRISGPGFNYNHTSYASPTPSASGNGIANPGYLEWEDSYNVNLTKASLLARTDLVDIVVEDDGMDIDGEGEGHHGDVDAAPVITASVLCARYGHKPEVVPKGEAGVRGFFGGRKRCRRCGKAVRGEAGAW